MCWTSELAKIQETQISIIVECLWTKGTFAARKAIYISKGLAGVFSVKFNNLFIQKKVDKKIIPIISAAPSMCHILKLHLSRIHCLLLCILLLMKTN